MVSMEKKFVPMNFLDSNKPCIISIEVCDSDEDEISNGNTPEKYVEAPGLPDLNEQLVSPIHSNSFNRQDFDKNNLNSTVLSSSSKSIQNTKETVTIDDNSDDYKREDVSECLSKVSDNLLNIIEMHRRITKNNKLSNRDKDKIKKHFLSMKYHYFSLSYDIVISLFIPRLTDKNFITNFLNDTINNSRVNRTFDCSDKTIKILFSEMIKWTKYKKEQIDFHKNIKRMEQDDQSNKTCDVNDNFHLERQNVCKENTKLKIKAKTVEITNNATANVIDNPQLSSKDDKICNNNKTCVVNNNGHLVQQIASKEATKLKIKAKTAKINNEATANVIENPQLSSNDDKICNDNKTCAVNNNGRLVQQIASKEGTKLKIKAKTAKINNEATATVFENPQLCPNNDKIMNNESKENEKMVTELKSQNNTNVISKEPNCLLEINFNNSNYTNINSEVTVKANDPMNCLKSLLNSPQIVINQNIYDNSNSVKNLQTIETPPKEKCIFSAGPAAQEVRINVQTQNYVNQKAVPPQTSLQKYCQNETSQYSSDDKNVCQSDSNMFNSHFENATISKSPHVVLKPPNYDEQQSIMELTLQSNIFINPREAPLHRNTCNSSNNQYQLALRENIGMNPNNQPQASLHRVTCNNSNNQSRPSLLGNTAINPDNQYQLPLRENIGMNPNNQSQASFPRITCNNSNNQSRPSLLGNTVINPDIQYQLALQNIGMNPNNQHQAPLYRPMHRNTGVNPTIDHMVPIFQGQTFGISPNYQYQLPMHGTNVINQNQAPIYGLTGINTINQYQPLNQRHNGVQHQPSLHTSSKRFLNNQQRPKLQRKNLKDYQPYQPTRQMNKSKTSSVTMSNDNLKNLNQMNPVNVQNENNISHQPQAAMEQCTPIITHVTSLNPNKAAYSECFVCNKLTTQKCRGCFYSYCSEGCQTLDWRNHMLRCEKFIELNNS